MSEETKEDVTEEAPAEEKAEVKETAGDDSKAEAAKTAETAAETKEETPAQGGEAKKKKINRFTPEELDKKIKDTEEKGLTQSVYYKHLMQRKGELETMKQ